MLTEKRIVITGAGSGIGRATSILAAGYGAKIVCVDLSDSVNSTVEEIVHNGGAATAVQADVSDETAVADFIAQCVTLYGGIDASLGTNTNAGAGSLSPVGVVEQLRYRTKDCYVEYANAPWTIPWKYSSEYTFGSMPHGDAAAEPPEQSSSRRPWSSSTAGGPSGGRDAAGRAGCRAWGRLL